eukprot:1115167-Amphidinium_carterae.1
MSYFLLKSAHSSKSKSTVNKRGINRHRVLGTQTICVSVKARFTKWKLFDTQHGCPKPSPTNVARDKQSQTRTAIEQPDGGNCLSLCRALMGGFWCKLYFKLTWVCSMRSSYQTTSKQHQTALSTPTHTLSVVAMIARS